jgi:hypothetical protein
VFKRFILISAGVMLGVSTAYAAAPAPQQAPKEVHHRNYDQKLHDCRKLGSESGLAGEALRAFVAECMKK